MPRLREYLTNALRQRAYRQRKKQREATIADLLRRLHHALTYSPVAGADPLTTLTNLVTYLEQGHGLPLTTRALLAQLEASLSQQAQIITALKEEPNQ
jgi:hypothetical protein